MLVLCGLLFYIGKLIIKKIEEICRKRVWFDRNANYIKFLAGFICTALAPSLSRQLSFKLSELSSFFHQEEVVSKQEQNDISCREFCLPFPKGLNSVKNLSEVLAWKRINMSCSGVRQHPYKGLDNRNEEKRSRISTLLFDALAGLLFYIFILNISPPDLLSSYFIQWRDETHQFLNNLLDWLMGAPAGLKLNQEMTVFFGNFFIYHVYIWIGYLSILEPYYNYIIMAIIYSSLLGFSVMLSLANDTLRALSFHTYCFYVYAAKVYKLQLQALISLSRLMRGDLQFCLHAQFYLSCLRSFVGISCQVYWWCEDGYWVMGGGGGARWPRSFWIFDNWPCLIAGFQIFSTYCIPTFHCSPNTSI